MNRRIGLSLICAMMPFGAWLHGEENQQCNIGISAPRSGENVSEDAQVQGTATIPAGKFLWVFAHRTGLALWWPQGGGPAVVNRSKWEVTASFGRERDVGRQFQVTAAVVDANTNEQLLAWVKKAEESGQYPGLRFPSTTSGCRIAEVTVTKVR